MNLEVYYQENYQGFVKKVKRRAGSVENAEDVVQEAFARALKYIGSFKEGKQNFDAWFNTILNNSLRTFMRNEKLYGMNMELDEEKLDGVEFMGVYRHAKNDIRKMIESHPQKEILSLFYISGYSSREISELVDSPLGTIFTTITRFQKEVKEKYGEGVDG